MREKLLLVKTAQVWVNKYYQIKDYVLLQIFRKDDTESYDVLIDTDDFELVSQGQWYCCIKRKNSHLKNIISILYTIEKDNKKTCYQLHQWILNTKRKGVIIDHINMNRLDNRRCNLREVTAKENRLNQEYKCFSKKRNVGFCSTIRVLGIDIESPTYATKEEAISKYLKACLLMGREKDSIFIKNKILENNIKISDEDYNDIFIAKVVCILNGDKINKHNNVKYKNEKVSRKYRGYNYDKQTGKFLVRVSVNNKAVNIGRYSTEYEAETMYLKASLVLENDNISDQIKDMATYLGIELTEEDYKNKYIQKIIMLKNNINTELPKEMNGRYNLKYDENIELIYDLHKQGYSWHGIEVYLKKNTDFKTAKGEIIKQRLNEYIEKLNNQKVS